MILVLLSAFIFVMVLVFSAVIGLYEAIKEVADRIDAIWGNFVDEEFDW